MSVTPSSHVIGMFTERAAADNAVEELHRSGFEDERIRYSTPGTSGGFFEDLKSLFTGTNAEAANLTHDLVNIGLSNEQAQRYADEYNNGNTILVVNAPGREEQVLGILYQYGAYSAHSTGVQFGGSNTPVSHMQQAANNVELNDYPSSDPGLQSHAHDLQAEAPVTHEHPFEDHAQEATTPFIPLPDVAEQPTQPVTSAYAPESRHDTNGSAAPEHNTENWTGSPDATDLAGSEHELATPAAETPVSTPAHTIAEHETETHDQAAQPAIATTEHAHEEHALPGHQASETSIPAYEERTENQMGEPVSIASEHEFAAEGAPHVSTTEYAPEHHVTSPEYSEHGEYNADEHRDPQDSVMMSEPASLPHTEQPDATIFQHETIEHPVTYDGIAAPTLESAEPSVAHESTVVPTLESAEHPVAHESAAIPEQETVARPEAVQSSTPVSDPEATEPLVGKDSTATHEPEAVATQSEPAQSSIPASISESPVTQPALSSASMPDYASKLQRLQEQLQASQQQLQEAKARLQSAKEHETQIQATREQLLAIQKELEATHAELNETHSRIDQY